MDGQITNTTTSGRQYRGGMLPPSDFDPKKKMADWIFGQMPEIM
jgi:hypothetical protein